MKKFQNNWFCVPRKSESTFGDLLPLTPFAILLPLPSSHNMFDTMEWLQWSLIAVSIAIVSFMQKPKNKNGISAEQLPGQTYWACVSINPSPHAIALLAQRPDKIIWQFLAQNKNPAAIPLIERKIDDLVRNNVPIRKDDWKHLSKNINAIPLLTKYEQLIHWEYLSGNPNAIHLLEQNPEKINWVQLSGNPNAIHWLERNPEKINWVQLSGNPKAMHLLIHNQDKIDLDRLVENPNPATMHFLMHKRNPDRIYLIEVYTFVWSREFGRIFIPIPTYNYAKIKQRMKDTIAEDLMKNRFHPRYMDKWAGWGQVEEEDFE